MFNIKKVFSATKPPAVNLNKNGDFNWTNIWTELPDMISVVLTVVGVLVVIYLIMGGFRYITAGGDEKKVEVAKKTITNAIIGLIVILLAFAIMQGVNSLIQG